MVRRKWRVELASRGAREEGLLILKEVASKRMRAETLGKLVS